MRLGLNRFRVKLTQNNNMHSLLFKAGLVCSFAILGSLGCRQSNVSHQSSEKEVASDLTEVVWQTDLRAAVGLARTTNKPILVLSILGDIGERC